MPASLLAWRVDAMQNSAAARRETCGADVCRGRKGAEEGELEDGQLPGPPGGAGEGGRRDLSPASREARRCALSDLWFPSCFRVLCTGWPACLNGSIGRPSERHPSALPGAALAVVGMFELDECHALWPSGMCEGPETRRHM